MIELRTLRSQIATALDEETNRQKVVYEDYLLMLEDIQRLRKRNKQLEQEKHSHARSIIKINSELIAENEFLKERVESLETELQKAKAEIKRLLTISSRNAAENTALSSQLINLKICLNQERLNKQIVEREFQRARASLVDLSKEFQLAKSQCDQLQFSKLTADFTTPSSSQTTSKGEYKPQICDAETKSELIDTEKDAFFDCNEHEESSIQEHSRPNDHGNTSPPPVFEFA